MSYLSSIIAVTFAVMLIGGNPDQDWEYLEDCDEICPIRPEAICQLRCRRIVNGQGEDCVNKFYDSDNKTVDCFF